jgi:hypothetical protein
MAKRFPLVSSPVYMDFLKGSASCLARRGACRLITSKAGRVPAI